MNINHSGTNTPQADDSVDALLRDVLGDAPPHCLIERAEEHLASFRTRINSQPTSARKPRANSLGRTLRWGLAACVAIAAALVALAWPQSLYAQAVKALKEVQSIHATVTRSPGDSSEELWYDKDLGTVKISFKNGIRKHEIDNGKRHWSHTSGTTYAIETPAREKPWGLVAELLSLEEFKSEGFKPVAGKRRVINGTECSLYSIMMQDGKEQIDVWLDEKTKLIHEWRELEKPTSEMEASTEVVRITYNEPLDPSRFTPNFGPHVRILKPAALLAKRFHLDKAILTKESMGLIFALHELERTDEGLIYVISSMRATDETLERFGTIRSGQPGVPAYGSYQLRSSWKRLHNGEERSYGIVTLAEMTYDGLCVKWSLLVPRGSWGNDADTYDLSIYIRTSRELRQARTKQGKPTQEHFKSLVQLPLRDAPVELSSVLKHLHEEAILQTPTVSQTIGLFAETDEEYVDDEGHTHKLFAFVPPSQLPLEDFVEHVRERITELQEK